MSLKTLCAVCGTPSAQSRCPRHRVSETERSRRRGASGWAVNAQRRRILERELYICRKCGRRATEADHIIPLSANGSNEDWNMQALCSPCHDRKTASERGRRR